MRRRAALLAASLALSGCASTELNYNTLDLASTTDDLMAQQALYNLANFIDSDLAYPAYIVVSAGTASTSDTLSSTLTAPLSKSITTTSQTVATAAATPTTAVTSLVTGVKSNLSLGLTGSDVRTQNWSYAPVTDAFRARRLMALYRYVVDGDAPKLQRDYPKIYKSVSHSRNTCLTDQNGKPILGNGKPPNTDNGNVLNVAHDFTRCITGFGASSGASATMGTDSETTMKPDSYYLQGPACVLCGRHLRVNPDLSGAWLHWRGLPGARRPNFYQPGDVSLGEHGHYELYLDQYQVEKFPKFLLFVLAAATQSDTGGGAAGSSSSSTSAGSKPPSFANCTLDAGGNLICTSPQ